MLPPSIDDKTGEEHSTRAPYNRPACLGAGNKGLHAHYAGLLQ
jgi:hypothetical protein